MYHSRMPAPGDHEARRRDVSQAVWRVLAARGFGGLRLRAVAAERMRGRVANVRAYAAGPPPMVDATLRMLLREGRLTPDNIRYDKFS